MLCAARDNFLIVQQSVGQKVNMQRGALNAGLQTAYTPHWDSPT